MNQSEDIKDLAAALAKAQSQIEKLTTDEKATVKSDKGSYSYTYASLAGVISTIRKALSDNGLCVVQSAEGGPDTVTIVSRLLHSTGQWLDSSLTLKPGRNDVQSIGSAITYGRRYQLMALAGIAPEDDDGKEASTKNEDVVKRDIPKSEPAKTQPSTESNTPGAAEWANQLALLKGKHNIKADEIKQFLGESIPEALKNGHTDMLERAYQQLSAKYEQKAS